MHVREVLLRLDQANKGMLECLLGPGGTLEALSIALSLIDGLKDAQAQALCLRSYAGMSLPPSRAAKKEEAGDGLSTSMGANVAGADGPSRARDDQLVALAESRNAVGAEILDLPEDSVEKMFQGGRDGMNEAVQMVQEICCCLGEVP